MPVRPFRVLALSALLGGTVLGGAAFANASDTKSDTHSGAQTAAVKSAALGQSIESGIRDARAMRAAGDLSGAVRVLSQLMLINADDGRVVSEYGKVLVQQGRTREALDFLNRAVQLTQNDWTLYSAQGVAYDGSGDYVSAKIAYDHALQLKPGDAVILNNYALSRAMAGDLTTAKALIAEAATSSKDERVARNVRMINALKPLAATRTATAPQPLPTKASANQASKTMPAATAASGPPRTLTTAEGKQIVMQAVPVDTQAGSVSKPRKTAAAKTPTPTQGKAAKSSDGIPSLRLANDRQ